MLIKVLLNSDEVILNLTSIQIPFGLAMLNTTLFVGDWGRQAIISYDTATKTERTIMSSIKPMGLLYSIRSRHSTGEGKRLKPVPVMFIIYYVANHFKADLLTKSINLRYICHVISCSYNDPCFIFCISVSSNNMRCYCYPYILWCRTFKR